MRNERLAAFSDGVFAIVITIMVLELKVPHGDTPEALAALVPHLLSYVLSFVYVAIYWNNHHHLLHVAPRVNGLVLWANMHLLFWLSLIPVATGWLGETHFAPWPTATYGLALLMPAFGWYLLQLAILSLEGRDSALAKALGCDVKGKISPLLYLTGIGLSFVEPRMADAIYVGVAILWLVPDRRFERALHEAGREAARLKQ
jgi:uncharacterized membrane protein